MLLTTMNAKAAKGAKTKISFASFAVFALYVVYMFLMMASPNSDVLSSVAPVIWRARSYVTFF